MDKKETVKELELTKTSKDTNKKIHPTEQENSNDSEYSMNNIILEMLNEMINEVLVEEKFEV